MDAKQLMGYFINNDFSGGYYKSVNEAFETAKLNAKKTDLIFVGGSTFVVAEII